jgi:hypothetical protein|tara:strand:- start:998 stop:1558 length:561 start_codon:yes stop_codon:yes gene_type:complete
MRGLEGNMMAQPRVFGHDAATVIAGAINIRIPAIEAVSISVVGSGYDQSDVGDTLAQSGATTPSGGTGMEVNITEVSAAGTLQAVEIITAGSGYDVGNVITLAAATSGGTGAKLTVLADGLTLPGLATSDRGAVIYNGNAEQSVEIITEAGSNVVFPKVQPGTVVGDKAPMLAKGVISGSNLVAIY